MKTKTMIAAAMAGIFVSAAAQDLMAQPRTDFRPDETVLLYGEKLVDNTDPVVAKKVTSAGFRMEEDNGLTGLKKSMNTETSATSMSTQGSTSIFRRIRTDRW